MLTNASVCRGSRHQALPELLEHHAVAGGGEVIVAENIEVLVPVLVGIARRKEGREQIDEGLAVPGAEIAP